eukprot:8345882-Pyramimonas_sp.AAC.1
MAQPLARPRRCMMRSANVIWSSGRGGLAPPIATLGRPIASPRPWRLEIYSNGTTYQWVMRVRMLWPISRRVSGEACGVAMVNGRCSSLEERAGGRLTLPSLRAWSGGRAVFPLADWR